MGPSTIYSCQGDAFAITQGTGNSGWFTDKPYCGNWPAPVWTNGGVPSSGNPPTSPPTTPPTTPPTSPPPATGNLAKGQPVVDNGHADVYVAGNAVDGNADTYWESTNNAFPRTITVDLGTTRAVKRVVLKLPPSSAWSTRTQTLSVLGSTDDSAFTTLKASAGYSFNPSSANTVTISLPGTSTRYLRLNVTGNTGWPAAQLSELEAYTS